MMDQVTLVIYIHVGVSTCFISDEGLGPKTSHLLVSNTSKIFGSII